MSSPLTPEQVGRVVSMAHDLARAGRTAELTELIAHGLPVDVADAEGNTALMLAAYRGHPETVAALLRLGADPDRLNDRGQAPLAGALFKGEDEVCRALLAAGARTDVGTPTAREAARLFGREQLLDQP